MNPASAKSAKDMISEARARIENVAPDDLARRLQDDDVLLVDLRDDDEVRRDGTLPGAKHVTRGMLEFRADADTAYYDGDFRKDRPIVLYCASGGRSALAGATLKDMGFERVAHLDGGVKAWRESGRSLETA